MIYGSFEKNMLEYLFEMERMNENLEEYPYLQKLDIDSARRSVALYFSEREKGRKLIINKENELGRKLSGEEYTQIDGPITAMGRRLKDDLMFDSAGFDGKSQVYSVATDYNKLVDEATGVIPPDYEKLLDRIKPLSRGERFKLIEGLHKCGKINWIQKEDLVKFFINYDDELEDNQKNYYETEIDMGEIKISPAYCPFRSCHSAEGKPLCMFVNKENEENSDDDEFTEQKTEDDYFDDEDTDDSHDYNAYDEDNDNDDSDSYSFNLNGAELDMNYGADYDVDFGDNSASLDFDGDPGDSGDSGDSGD